MTLKKTIDEALRLTSALHRALKDESETNVEVLLEERAAALKAFETQHRQATVSERSTSTTQLRELQTADRELTEYCGMAKDELAVRANQIVQCSGLNSNSQTEPDRIPLIDRKA